MEIVSINTWALSHLQDSKLTFRRTDHAVKRMVESIRVYGLRILLLASRAGEITARHFGAKAARSLGFAQLPVDSTQELVELLRRPILNHTGRGALAYDPFLGSGTALTAQLSSALRTQAKRQAAEQEVNSAAA